MSRSERGPGFWTQMKWSAAMLAGSLAVAALAIPLLRWLGFMR